MTTNLLNGENAAEILGSAPSILIHSGNVASWSKLRRKGVLSPTNELVSTIDASFISWLGRQGEVMPGQREVIVVKNSGLCRKVEEAEVSSHIFSLKIFLRYWQPHLLRDAVQTTLDELGLSQVHTLIISFPYSADSKVAMMHPIWKEAELLAQEGMFQVAGVADLDKEKLAELYEWASNKPKVNQVNLAHCCTIPEDLQEYSKDQGIKLTTHNDDRDILPSDQLASTLSAVLEGRGIDLTSWDTWWVVRYSSIINLRGIIAHKGYLLRLDTASSAV